MLSGERVKRTLKNLAARTGKFDRLFSQYPYMFTPQQLQFLTLCVADTKDVPGCIVEAGCAFGATTVYVKKFMAGAGIEKDYFAIDTFSGFPEYQASYEITERGKSQDVTTAFSNNNKLWFDTAMRAEGIKQIRSFCADITKFDFDSIDRIAFCLLDVDLYLPIKDALPKLYQRLSPGGMIVVDDCAPGGDWDGALKAYQEFCSENGFHTEICESKLGIVRKAVTA